MWHALGEISTYSRNPLTGELVFLGEFKDQRARSPRHLSFGGDGKFAYYSGMGMMSVLKRHSNGTLTLLQTLNTEDFSLTLELATTFHHIIMPDKSTLYAFAQESVGVFNIGTDGQLQIETIFRAKAEGWGTSNEQYHEPSAVATDITGRYIYVVANGFIFIFQRGCTRCPTGSYCVPDSFRGPVACLAGTANQELGQTACKSCLDGYYSDIEGSEQCTPCPHGTYGQGEQDKESYCKPCPQGTYSAALAADSVSLCSPCLPGTKGNNGTGFSGSDSACAECDPGRFSSQPGSLECKACDSGISKAGSSFCTLCPAGKTEYNNECRDCPDGWYAYYGGSECSECVAGRYASPSKDECLLCPAGKFGNASEQSSEDACFECPLGKYSVTPGSTVCMDCAPGKKGDDNVQLRAKESIACVDCDAGRFSSASGAQDCQPCEGGVSNNGSSFCESCPAGKFQSDKICEACPKGWYAYSGASECSECVPGRYATPSGHECLLCPPGKFGNMSQQSNEDACFVCPLGKYSNTPGSITCMDCTPGKRGNITSTERTKESTACSDCEAGRFSSESGAQTCNACTGGVSAKGSSYCEACPAGKFQANKTCQDCQKGWYAFAAASECSPCGAGRYSSPLKDECILCPKGKFGNASQQSSESSACFDCAIGAYNPNQGSTACLKCPVGTSGNEKATLRIDELDSCRACPIGRFQNMDGQAQCRHPSEGADSELLLWGKGYAPYNGSSLP